MAQEQTHQVIGVPYRTYSAKFSWIGFLQIFAEIIFAD